MSRSVFAYGAALAVCIFVPLNAFMADNSLSPKNLVLWDIVISAKPFLKIQTLMFRRSPNLRPLWISPVLSVIG